MEIEIDIPRPLPVHAHKVLVPRWSLVLIITRQHALKAHADALDVVHRAPAGLVEEVQADDAVGVHVRVHGDRVRGVGCEGDFGGFCTPRENVSVCEGEEEESPGDGRARVNLPMG